MENPGQIPVAANNRQGQFLDLTSSAAQIDGMASHDAVVYVADMSRPLYKGYNIKLYTGDVGKAASFKKGQAIRFKGYIDDFDSKDPGAVVELKSVTF